MLLLFLFPVFLRRICEIKQAFLRNVPSWHIKLTLELIHVFYQQPIFNIFAVISAVYTQTMFSLDSYTRIILLQERRWGENGSRACWPPSSSHQLTVLLYFMNFSKKKKKICLGFFHMSYRIWRGPSELRRRNVVASFCSMSSLLSHLIRYRLTPLSSSGRDKTHSP